ncbi:MAG: KOW domain-containing RNA-binding protein [Synergistaceae bacterium]|jgi:ribosomal protein L14E/L6E/L27E|nr:KOW domain-containing RNA-binding protein [Synergistaceae bacterium]
MDRLLDGYRVGQIVISKRGKDVGRAYVIAGFIDGNKLALADAKRFNVSCPKPKNPRHVQVTSRFLDAEMIAAIEKGRDIDHGEFWRFLTTLEESV